MVCLRIGHPDKPLKKLKKMKKIVSVLLIVLVLSSCNEYQKALKSEDADVKYGMGLKLFESEKYSKAIRIFEQIAPTYRGKTDAEKMYFMFAQAYYKTSQYYLAGYQFESFVSNYPKSGKLEEAAFLGAKCFSMLSPVYSLDQTDTSKAIDKLQAYIDSYPNSSNVSEANKILKSLNEKIEKKVFENAKGYNLVMDYKAAIISFDSFIADYPGTPFKEDAMFYKYDSAYQLAINSIQSKMEERLIAAKLAHANLIKFRPETKYKEKASQMLTQIENKLQNFTKK